MTRMLELFFGTDQMTFSVTSLYPLAIQKTRTYRRFSDAAEDVVDARIYEGIHFRFADQGSRSRAGTWPSGSSSTSCCLPMMMMMMMTTVTMTIVAGSELTRLGQVQTCPGTAKAYPDSDGWVVRTFSLLYFGKHTRLGLVRMAIPRRTYTRLTWIM